MLKSEWILEYKLAQPPLIHVFIHSYVHPIFTEDLLCARHVPNSGIMKLSTTQTRAQGISFLEQKASSVKGQRGNNFDFADLTVPVIATQLCHYAQAAIAFPLTFTSKISFFF